MGVFLNKIGGIADKAAYSLFNPFSRDFRFVCERGCLRCGICSVLIVELIFRVRVRIEERRAPGRARGASLVF